MSLSLKPPDVPLIERYGGTLSCFSMLCCVSPCVYWCVQTCSVHVCLQILPQSPVFMWGRLHMHSMFAFRPFHSFAPPPSAPSHARCAPSVFIHQSFFLSYKNHPSPFRLHFLNHVIRIRIWLCVLEQWNHPPSPLSLHYPPRQTIMCGKLWGNVCCRLIPQAYTLQQNLTDTIAWIAPWLSINQGTVLTPSHNAGGCLLWIFNMWRCILLLPRGLEWLRCLTAKGRFWSYSYYINKLKDGENMRNL